jgi:hypothetical protein
MRRTRLSAIAFLILVLGCSPAPQPAAEPAPKLTPPEGPGHFYGRVQQGGQPNDRGEVWFRVKGLPDPSAPDRKVVPFFLPQGAGTVPGGGMGPPSQVALRSGEPTQLRVGQVVRVWSYSVLMSYPPKVLPLFVLVESDAD